MEATVTVSFFFRSVSYALLQKIVSTKLVLLHQLSGIWNHKQAPLGRSLMLKPLSSGSS